MPRSTARGIPAVAERVRATVVHEGSADSDTEQGGHLRREALADVRFQALLSRFLRESLPNCEVEDELPLRGMMAYRLGANPKNRRPPLPRPDFAVRARRGPRQLLDAKYRDIWEKDLPREMLYQLAVYAMSQPPGATAAILYPTEDPAARESIVEIREPASSAIRAFVALRPVVIGQLLDLVREGAARSRECEQLALRMVFGQPE